MEPIINVEYRSKSGDLVFNEESVSFHDPEELFQYVSPGGGCEKIPDEVHRIHMNFLPPRHPNTQNPLADKPTTLELGMVFFMGPLSEITQTAEQLLDKAGRGELSDSFLTVIGAERQSRP